MRASSSGPRTRRCPTRRADRGLPRGARRGAAGSINNAAARASTVLSGSAVRTTSVLRRAPSRESRPTPERRSPPGRVRPVPVVAVHPRHASGQLRGARCARPRRASRRRAEGVRARVRLCDRVASSAAGASTPRLSALPKQSWPGRARTPRTARTAAPPANPLTRRLPRQHVGEFTEARRRASSAAFITSRPATP